MSVGEYVRLLHLHALKLHLVAHLVAVVVGVNDNI